MWETIEKLDTMMLKNQTEFIAGKSPSIADLLFFYELSNLVYFRANHQKYRWISGWYQNIYAIP
jgi:glutathione S-transferase